ncbi:hypothetical protein SASPL_133426 [Salvia splendens]|uniref:Uncharacterized protein n=1 Tax=Salvia splendens TaxID=180675 RepID=A0A8X8X3S3_SALSN|nr:hypothetical protein SASPL_133426 [Salvia splendens]
MDRGRGQLEETTSLCKRRMVKGVNGDLFGMGVVQGVGDGHGEVEFTDLGEDLEAADVNAQDQGGDFQIQEDGGSPRGLSNRFSMLYSLSVESSGGLCTGPSAFTPFLKLLPNGDYEDEKYEDEKDWDYEEDPEDENMPQSEVDRCWREKTGTRGMINVQLKLSRLKRSLKIWNRVVFGNIFEKLRKAEAEAREAQEKYEQEPSPDLRYDMNRTTAEYLSQRFSPV